jgi:uncharacterized protein YyaL (SSP411 family)
MAASPLRDPVDGGFFRYATKRDWSEPHYERMLYDNALLLRDYGIAWQRTGESWAEGAADGAARFLLDVLRRPSGGFASAQDSESLIDGVRVEGGYYRASARERAQLAAPPLDEKVLTGWNGFAISALARSGFALNRPAWIAAAREAADALLDRHVRPDGTLVRASLGERVSDAGATLEDYGGFARGLLDVALVTGAARYAEAARDLVDLCIDATVDEHCPFGVPGGGDPVLESNGMGIRVDPSEGAYPSGLSATASAAHLLHLLTGERRYERSAREAMRLVAAQAEQTPSAFGAALELMSALAVEPEQLVLVVPDADTVPDSDRGLLDVVRRRSTDAVAVVDDAGCREFAVAGFELFEGRASRDGLPTAYLCHDFVCRLPVTDADALRDAASHD